MVRTTIPVLVVLALGTAAVMLGMSGFADVWGSPTPQVERAGDHVNESAASVSPQNGSVQGPVSSGDSSIVGLIADGLGSLTDIAGGVVLLPLTLIKLGFPRWFAIPIGSLAELIVGIGLFEFATNREWT